MKETGEWTKVADYGFTGGIYAQGDKRELRDNGEVIVVYNFNDELVNPFPGYQVKESAFPGVKE